MRLRISVGAQAGIEHVWYVLFDHYIKASLRPFKFSDQCPSSNIQASPFSCASKSSLYYSDTKRKRPAFVISSQSAQGKSLHDVVARHPDEEAASNDVVEPSKNDENDKVGRTHLTHISC